MKLSIKQKSFGGLIALLVLFIITNPSAQAFKEHVGSPTYNELYKDKNLFVMSLYRYHGTKYIAILGNFWKERKAPEPTGPLRDSVAVTKRDSTVTGIDVFSRDTTHIKSRANAHIDKEIEEFIKSKHKKHG